MYLPLRVVGDDAPYPAEIGRVHADNPVELSVILPRYLSGGFGAVERHSVLSEASACGRIDAAADFFGRYCCALHIKALCHTVSVYEGFEYEFRHWGAANVAVAHKENLNHIVQLFAQK